MGDTVIDVEEDPTVSDGFVDSFVKATGETLCHNKGTLFDSSSRNGSRKEIPIVRLSATRASRGRSYVIDRKGRRVAPRWDEITKRIEELCSDPAYGPPLDDIDAPMITRQVTMRFRNGMTTRELDAAIVQLCSSFGDSSDDWLALPARICVSDLHKRSHASMEVMYNALLKAAPTRVAARLSEEHLGIVRRFSKEIDARLKFDRDYRFQIFGFQTVARGYLTRSRARAEELTLLDDQIMERPQHWYMREALGAFCEQVDGKGHLAPEPVARARLQEALDHYDRLSLHLLSHATPTALNAGTKRRQMSSCFQLSADDNMESITDAWKHAALISKWSGGQSCAMHAIRAESAPILGTGGKSSGLKRLFKVFNEVQVYVDQGGNRPGAFAMYLEPWHADIFTFLELARLKGVPVNAPDLKYALWLSDEFMREVDRDGDWYLMSPDESPGLHRVWGDAFVALYRKYVAEGKYRRKVKARDVIKAAWETIRQVGNPYLLFKDHINRKSNLQNVATITCSNLCVDGDTQVLTYQGYKTIREIVGHTLDVWNGADWSRVLIAKTNDAAELIHIRFSNGAALNCTPDHKFYNKRGHEVRARDLVPGIELEKCEKWPVIEGGLNIPDAYTRGLFSADGQVNRLPGTKDHRCRYKATMGDTCEKHTGRVIRTGYPVDGTCRTLVNGDHVLKLYGDKKKLIEFVERRRDLDPKETKEFILVNLRDGVGPKFSVPLDGNLTSRLRWLEGYCDGDGCVSRNGNCYSIQCSSVELGFLNNIRLMLQTMGCDPKIALMHKAGYRILKGKTYWHRDCYRLLITAWDVKILVDLGFSPKRLDLSGAGKPNRDARRFVSIVSIEKLEEFHETYCFTEHKRHRGVFNGILTGQCAEVTIPCWSDSEAKEFGANDGEGEYGVCTLGAIPLENYITEGKTSEKHLSMDWPLLIVNAGHMARALDKINTLNYYPTEQCRRSTMRHRPIGIGIMGLADVFARFKIAFGSPEALALDRGISAAIYYGALSESCAMAETEGAFPSFNYNGGCPLSKGKLQPDLWVESKHLSADWEKEVEVILAPHITASHWADLRERAKKGVRNAYVTAYMPTATTSNMIGQNECFEPRTANIYPRTTSAGEFWTVNRHLVRDLRAEGVWDDKMRKAIITAGGSVQGNPRVPAKLQRLYKTAREMDQRVILLHAKARAPFICQTMSLNYYFNSPTLGDVATLLTLAWEAGLKTASYYMHSAPAAGGQKSSVMSTDGAESDIEDGSDGSDYDSDEETEGLPEAHAAFRTELKRSRSSPEDEERRLEEEAIEKVRAEFQKRREAHKARDAFQYATSQQLMGADADPTAPESVKSCAYVPPGQRNGPCIPCGV